MKNNKILRIFLIGLLLLFLIHQVFSLIFNPVKTRSAEYAEIIDGISVQGMVIREEMVIKNEHSGVLHFEVSEGERVSNGGVVAEVYDSASTSYTVSRIKEIKDQIKDIENLQGYNSVIASDEKLAKAKVNEALSDLIISCRSGDISAASSLTQKLAGAISRHQMITGEQTDFSARLTELNTELQKLSATLPSPSAYVRAPMSGYYLTRVDGYETVFAGKSEEEITPEFLDNLKPEKTAQDNAGKIVSGYEWLIAAKIPVSELQRFSVGDELSVQTAVNGGTELSVTVKAINLSKDRKEASIILACGSVNRELVSMRSGTFTLVSNVYRGLKVAKSALRIIDGKTGVYVKNGGMIKFVPVEVVYTKEDEDYIICKKNDTNDNALRLYDDVVVKGKKLYDGKAVG